MPPEMAPALVVTAGHDMLADEGQAYADHLRRVRTPVEHLHFARLGHASDWARAPALSINPANKHTTFLDHCNIVNLLVLLVNNSFVCAKRLSYTCGL